MKKLPVLLILVLSLFAGNFPVSASTPTLSEHSLAAFTQLNLYPNIETVGVVVSGTDLPRNANLLYRKSGETTWRNGHPLMRIDDGRLAGSLFSLAPSTNYEIKVLDGATEISGSVTTQANDLQFTPTVVLHVNDDAPAGGDGPVHRPAHRHQHDRRPLFRRGFLRPDGRDAGAGGDRLLCGVEHAEQCPLCLIPTYGAALPCR